MEKKELKCACGSVLEEGFMGALWCPKCEDKWEIPKGKEKEDGYYFIIRTMMRGTN